MQTLVRAMKASPEAGEALPTVFRGFDDYGIHFRRGQLSLLAAASGGCKSAIAVHIATHGKIPSMYCSADTDTNTLGSRVAASVTGRLVDVCESDLRANDDNLWRVLAQETAHVWFYWETTPSCQDIDDEVTAYAIENGEYPHLIVIDNLINVETDGEAGHAQKDGVLTYLAMLAESTNAHVLVLHHVTKQYVNGDIPIPKEGLLDSVDKRPRLVLTAYRIDDNHVGVRVVKNSGGKAYTDASWGPDLGVMLEQMWIAG